MANEISYSFSISYSNGSNGVSVGKSGQMNQTTAKHESKVVQADTTAAGVSVAFSNLTSAGLVMATNLDSSVDASYGGSSGGAFVKVGEIKAGKTIPIFAGGTTFYIQTAASTANIQFDAIDE